MATADLRERILGRLDEVKDPCSVATGAPMGLAEMGLVKSVEVGQDGEVRVVLRLTSPFCEMIGFLKSSAIAGIQQESGVASVTVESDSGFDWSPEDMAPHLQQRRQERLAAVRADVAAHRARSRTAQSRTAQSRTALSRTALPLTIARRETTP